MTSSTQEFKKVTLDLTELDGNAFALIGAFCRQARREGWMKEDIDYVTAEMRNGDYDHLLQTLMKYTEMPYETNDEEDEWEMQD